MSQDGKNKPTTEKGQFVASEETRSREIRRFLAMLVRFIRKEPPLPPLEGHLSLWMCETHGVTAYRTGQDPAGSLSLEALKIFSAETNPQSVSRRTADSLAIVANPEVTRLLETVKQGNITEVNADFEETLRKAVDIWFPGFRLPIELSVANVLKLLRVSRASFICTALHGTQPLILIARAWRGDKKAVLDLIRVDKLFVQDPCTQKVIKQAALQNDQEFLVQLANAQKYKAVLRPRDLFHIYFFLLFLCEELGQSPPRIDELQRLLDPRGMKFEGLYAFERDLQRRRAEFREMLEKRERGTPYAAELLRLGFAECQLTLAKKC